MCVVLKYTHDNEAGGDGSGSGCFRALLRQFDGIIVRIEQGQMAPEAQAAFDGLMRERIAAGTPVWSTGLLPAEGGEADGPSSEFVCACEGIGHFQAHASPDKGLDDVPAADLEEGTRVADATGSGVVATVKARRGL